MEVSGELHNPATLPSGKNAGPHWILDGVGPTATLDVSETTKIACSAVVSV